jgi:perosamine synthetase
VKPIPSYQDVLWAVHEARPWRPSAILPFEATEDDCAAALRTIQDDPIGRTALRTFEECLQRISGLPCAVAVSSGTAALELALRAVGVKPGDEVIIPALTFAGAAAAVMHCGATPRFVDCLSVPFGAIAWFKLDRHLRSLPSITLAKIKAVMVVDLLGHPCVTPELRELCDAFHFALVEDGAAALGAVGLGRWADVATLSFNNNKIVTTTGGGAVLTADEGLARRVRHLATTARVERPFLYEYDDIGFNYRLSNLLAAMALPQLDRLESTVGKKHGLAARYSRAFSGLPDFTFVEQPSAGNAWLNAVLVDPPHEKGARRDAVMKGLAARKIGCRALFTPLHMVGPYKDCPRQPNLETAEELFYRAVCLPSGVDPWA